MFQRWEHHFGYFLVGKGLGSYHMTCTLRKVRKIEGEESQNVRQFDVTQFLYDNNVVNLCQNESKIFHFLHKTLRSFHLHTILSVCSTLPRVSWVSQSYLIERLNEWRWFSFQDLSACHSNMRPRNEIIQHLARVCGQGAADLLDGWVLCAHCMAWASTTHLPHMFIAREGWDGIKRSGHITCYPFGRKPYSV